MFRKILVGTDGSKTAAKAVDRAVSLAASTGASLTILTAGEGERGEAVVAAEAARHSGSGVVIDTRVISGDPASVLAEVADADGYDLLVVGNKGMTGARRFFTIGSVPNKVTHHLPVSLLIVRTT
jgi:nucleotide-binding universal stress UspA family protein